MKKSKLLIPALSVASVGAVVAPMVTSCTKNNNRVDLLNFNPSIAQLPRWGALTKQQATQALFDAPNSVEILTQDINYYLSYNVKVVEYWRQILEDLGLTWAGAVKSAYSEITNVKVEYKDVYNKTTGVWEDCHGIVSGDIKLFVETSVIDNGKDIGTYTLETHHKVSNLIYDINYKGILSDEDTNKCWKTYLNPTKLQADSAWSVERTYTGKAVYTNGDKPEEETDTYTYDKSHISTAEEKAGLGFLNFWSYYLDLVKQAA